MIPSLRRAAAKLLTIAVLVCIFVGPVWGGDYPPPLYSKDGHDISFYRAPESIEPLSNPEGKPPRNVVICIGDGMGPNQVALARRRRIGAGGKLWMERMPFAGWVRTHNVEGKITDSAAAITAISCGVKTKNGMIGQDPDGFFYMTIARRLQEEGYRIGAVATCTITHATPAGMVAHIPDRNKEADIAVQMLGARFDVLFGGGRKFWLPESQKGGLRKDDRNLLSEAKESGYQIVSTAAQMQAVSAGPVIGLFEDDAMTTQTPEPSLAEMTRAALRILSHGQEPFILLVEGSQIDWACHLNNENACARQTLLFDMAVKEILDFAAADRRTLILVTADHETGGLTLIERNGQLKAQWATKDHSAADVPIYTYGPGAEQFDGVLDNTEIPDQIARLLGIEDFPHRLTKDEEPKEALVEEMSTR